MNKKPYKIEHRIPFFDTSVGLEVSITEEGWHQIDTVIQTMLTLFREGRPRLEFSPKGVTVNCYSGYAPIGEVRVIICGTLAVTVEAWVPRIGPVTLTLYCFDIRNHFEDNNDPGYAD